MSNEIPKTQLIPPEASLKVLEAMASCPAVVEITVQDDAGLQMVWDTITKLKERRAELVALRQELKRPYQSKIEIFDTFCRHPIAMHDAAIEVYERGAGAYLLQKKIEQQKLLAKATAETEARKQQAVTESERQMGEFDRAIEAGDIEKATEAQGKAEAAAVEAANVVTPVVERALPHGGTPREIFEAVVVDKQKAVSALMANAALEAYVQIETKGLSDFGTKRGGSIPIPGIRWEPRIKHRRVTRRGIA